uniref:Basal body orientation factor 1b n=1 Tax=Hippocampus comes TaxID=109280 RepID=A0A3Q2XCP4_HIPCM
LQLRKGKKSGKREPKTDKDLDLDNAKTNVARREVRLRLTEQTLAEYRESCGQLARVNSELVSKLARAEQEILEATDNWLKREAAKDEEVEHYTLEISEMKVLFRKRAGEFETIRDGMRTIEEFQTRKAQMEQELNNSDVKTCLPARLEKDAEEMIAQVEEQAHHEAVLQLDDASRCVFKENVRLNETLKHHMKEAEELHKMADSLAKENTSLAMDKVTLRAKRMANSATAIIRQCFRYKKMSNFSNRGSYEASNSERFEEKMLLSRQADKAEFEKLQSVLSMREKELKHIKRLAGAVMEQRSELERFFHEALAQVKDEIAAARLQYKKEAQQAYRWTLKQATAGRIKFPPIRTFQNTPDSNFTSFFRIHQPGDKVEFSDLTWEQKEHVLRLLFAKMNRQRPREEPCALSTFITQAPNSLGPTNTNCLEERHTT